MHEQLLKLVGRLYALIGLASLPSFFFMLAYGPKPGGTASESIVSPVILLGAPLVWCGVFGLLGYSFFTLKRWGRYLAILSNGFLIGAVMLGFVAGRVNESALPELTPPALLFLIGFFVVFGSLFVLCFWSPVKRLMCH
jgi:hypothetical protein